MVYPRYLDGLDGEHNRKLERHNRGMLLVVADKGFWDDGKNVRVVGVESRGTFDVVWR